MTTRISPHFPSHNSSYSIAILGGGCVNCKPRFRWKILPKRSYLVIFRDAIPFPCLVMKGCDPPPPPLSKLSTFAFELLPFPLLHPPLTFRPSETPATAPDFILKMELPHRTKSNKEINIIYSCTSSVQLSHSVKSSYSGFTSCDPHIHDGVLYRVSLFIYLHHQYEVNLRSALHRYNMRS